MGIPGGSWKKTNNKQNGGLIELVGRDRGRKEERERVVPLSGGEEERRVKSFKTKTKKEKPIAC